MNIHYMKQLVQTKESLEDIERVFKALVLDDFKECYSSTQDREILWEKAASGIRDLWWVYRNMFEAMHNEK